MHVPCRSMHAIWSLESANSSLWRIQAPRRVKLVDIGLRIAYDDHIEGNGSS